MSNPITPSSKELHRLLYSFQLGEHGKALRIFVHKMKDFAAAEDYCDQVLYIFGLCLFPMLSAS